MCAKLWFLKTISDPSLFTLRTSTSFTILLVYVDSVTLAGASLNLIQDVKAYLHNPLNFKDIGPLKFFFRLEVAKFSTGINVCKRKYILNLLIEFGYVHAKPVSTPIDCSS